MEAVVGSPTGFKTGEKKIEQSMECQDLPGF